MTTPVAHGTGFVHLVLIHSGTGVVNVYENDRLTKIIDTRTGGYVLNFR